MVLWKWFLVATVLFTIPLRANAEILHASATENEAGDVIVPESFYEASLGGLRAYVYRLQETDPKAFEALKPGIDALEEKAERAMSAASVIGFAGAVLAVGSFSFLRTQRANSRGGTIRETNNQVMAFGVGLLVAAVAAYAALTPGDQDVMDFVNDHNQIRPESPLRFELGLPAVPAQLHEISSSAVPSSMGTLGGGFALHF